MHADHVMAIRKISNSNSAQFNFNSDSQINLNDGNMMCEILKKLEYIKNKLNKIEDKLNNMELLENKSNTSNIKSENKNISKSMRADKEFIPSIDISPDDNVQIKTIKKTSNLSLDDSLNALNKINLMG